MSNTALIVGASGIVGSATAALLQQEGWRVAGLARHPVAQAGVDPVAGDLQDPASLEKALADLAPSHVFLATWQRRPTEAEMIRVNRAMVENVLDALRPKKSVRHVALVTGLKHYLGPFEAYAAGQVPETPFHEEEPRLDTPNFYYAQEDELFAAAARQGFTWSVHRSHTVIGYAVGNAMNMGLTLAVQGQWRSYAITLAWCGRDEVLRLVCSFDMDPPAARLAPLYEVLNLANDAVWEGGFAFWAPQRLMVWRYGLVLSGGAIAAPEQIDRMIRSAIDSCERFYPAFQLTCWGDTAPAAAIGIAMGEAYGRA